MRSTRLKTAKRPKEVPRGLLKGRKNTDVGCFHKPRTCPLEGGFQ